MDALDKLKAEKLCPSSPIPSCPCWRRPKDPTGLHQKNSLASRKPLPLLADQNHQQGDKASDKGQADPDNRHRVVPERHWKKQGREGVSWSGEHTAELRDVPTPWSSKIKPWADNGVMVFKDEAPIPSFEPLPVHRDHSHVGKPRRDLRKPW